MKSVAVGISGLMAVAYYTFNKSKVKVPNPIPTENMKKGYHFPYDDDIGKYRNSKAFHSTKILEEVFMSNERFYSIPEQPLSNEELNDRMFKMLRDRARQSAEFREKYNPKGPTGSTGSNDVTAPTGHTGAKGISYKV